VAYTEFAAATSRICEGALAVNGPLQPEVTAAWLWGVMYVPALDCEQGWSANRSIHLPSWSQVTACACVFSPLLARVMYSHVLLGNVNITPYTCSPKVPYSIVQQLY